MTAFADRVVELDTALTEARLPHSFGGAIALIYAVADPRLTHDIDLNLSVPVDDAPRVFEALPASLPWTDADIREVQERGQVRLRWDPTLPVDLFFPQHDFHRTVAERTRYQLLDGHPLPVISPTDLTVFKALFNRTKDWADIESMLRAGTVDVGDALRWIAVIVGDDHPSYARLAELADQALVRPDADPNIWRRA